MKKVSFDFDGTLDRKDVQEYAKELINKGVEVLVCTFRTREYNDELFKIVDKSTPANQDLFKVTDKLGIKRENIIFTEMEDKSEHLPKDIVWHLDDDHSVMYDVRGKCIDVNKSSYKNKCNRLLGL